MTVVLGDGVPEVFESLPFALRKKDAEIIELIALFPEMYPIRRRGLMRGYRWCSITSSIIRLPPPKFEFRR